MANERRSFSGGAAATTLSGTFNPPATTFNVASGGGTGYPTGAGGPFWIVIDRNTSKEEKVLCSGRSSDSFTIVGARGDHTDGTSVSTHSNSAVVEHVHVAQDDDEANNAVVNTIGRVTAAGDLLYASAANALARLPIGSGTQLLTVVAGAPAWANLPANSIGASQLQTDSVGTGPIAPLAVTSAELAASSVTAGKIASGGISSSTQFAAGVVDASAQSADQRHEPGDIKFSARSSPTTGWIVCDGSAVSRTTFAALFSAIGTAYGVGDGSTTFNIPDYRGKVILGAGTGLAPNNTARSRGQVGGEETHVLTQAEMPTHNHTSPAHNHSGSTTTADASGLGAGAAAGGTAITFTDGTVTVASEAVTIQNAGSSAAHQNMPPFGVANVFIKT